MYKYTTINDKNYGQGNLKDTRMRTIAGNINDSLSRAGPPIGLIPGKFGN